MTTTSEAPSRTTLVLGGTGRTGRRVAARLAARGRPVRIGSRRGEPPFDWADPSGWRRARREVEAAYVAYYPDLAFPGAAERIGALAELAVDEGVDLEDVADVAALTGEASAGEVHEVTGPRLLTFGDAAAEISRATGREVRYVPVTAAEYAAAATGHGVPAEEADDLADLFARVLDGRNARLTDGVRRALGRAPRDFADYARTAAATGVWES
jgi:uncharacterized protein YbjT (DUF2867 family)